MDRLRGIFVVGLLLLTVPACSKSPQTTETTVATPATLTGLPDKDASPDKFVTALLTAAQTGNKATVMALLSSNTPDAARSNIAAALDSCRNSKFEVGHWEMISDANDRAHVACTLIDQDEKGAEMRHDVVCGLAKENGSWRVVGMVPVEPPPPGMPDKDTPPDKTVSAFLKAAQAGNSEMLAAMLSSVARVETALNNITFQPDSYKNSRFEIGRFEYITPQKDGAHVACKWIDRDEQGTELKHDVIWVLRKEAAGWRIVGMITRPFPDKQAVIFDYEDIPSLVAAKNFIEVESNRRDAEQQKQASQKKPLTASSTDPKTGVQAPASNVEREAMKPSASSTPSAR